MIYPNDISSKLPHVGTNIFTVMSTLANEHNAINLSQGFPDFPISEKLVELVNQAMKAGYNQYCPMQGLPQLREVLVDKANKLYGTKYDANKEINITAGATQAIFTAISAFVKEEDEVIILTPAYDCYAPAVELCGGKPVYVQLEFPTYKVNWENVQKMITRNTRMIIVNSPHNPTGTIFSAKDLEELEKLTKNSNIIVLSDEVYEHIIFDGEKHQSVCKNEELAKRSIITYSFGKTFHATGWKMGYVLAPENLMEEFRKVHQFNVFTCNTPMQHALANFLKEEENYMGLDELYSTKRDIFLSAVRDSKFKPIPCKGTYFQLLNYSGITDEKDTEYATRLTKEFSVASIPVSVFYSQPTDNKVLRFCFAKQNDTLEKAGEILSKIK